MATFTPIKNLSNNQETPEVTTSINIETIAYLINHINLELNTILIKLSIVENLFTNYMHPALSSINDTKNILEDLSHIIHVAKQLTDTIINTNDANIHGQSEDAYQV